MYSLITYIFAFLLSFLPIPTISYGEIGTPISFSPLQTQQDNEKLVESLVFRKLLTVDNLTGTFYYDLAEDITSNTNNTEYVIKLKKNQFFSDGKEITADDVLYSSSVSTILKEVSFDKIDKYSVKFTLPTSYSPFKSLLTFSILPAHIENNDTNSLVTSSQYRIVKIKRDASSIKEVSLIKVIHPFIKVHIRFYEKEEDLILASKLGEVNVFMINNDKNIENFNKKILTFPSRSYVLIFNTKKDYLTKDIRKQIISNINFDILLKEQPYRLANISKGPLESTWAYDSTINFNYNFKPQKITISKESIKIVGADINIIRKISDSIKKDLEDNANLNIDTELIDNDKFFDKLRQSDYDLLIMAMEFKNDPDRYVFWHSSQIDTGLNYSNISNLRIDKSLEKGRDFTDIKTRKEDYRVFQIVFAEELPAYFMFNPTKTIYYKTLYKSIDLNGVFYPYDILKNVDKWIFQNPKIII